MAKLSQSLELSRTPSSEPKASILLVDDNPANLLSLRALLDGLGQNLVEARSGEEAIKLAKAEDFAVVLLDVVMPGINGFETAKAIRGQERSQHTPVIFLTANDIDRSQMEEGYALGAVDFLVKPLLPLAVQAKVRGFVQLFQDKQRTKYEADLFRLLVQGTSDYAIFMLDPEGHIVTWNPGAERLKGYRAEEIIGQHFSLFYPPDAIERNWPKHELDVARNVGRFEDEGWRVRKDGSQFWANVVITTLRDSQGILQGFSKITRDLTERKKSEEDARRLAEEATARRLAEENARLIQEQRERLHVTLASIGDAVISTDAEGRVDFLNTVAQQLVGWKNEAAAGRTLSDVFRIVNEETRQPVENPALRALQEGVVVGLANHSVLIAKDGSELPIDDSAAPIRNAGGDIIGSVLVFRDVSEQRRASQASRQHQELLQLIHKIGKIGHWEWNSLTDQNKWSPEIEALYGLPPGGFEGGYQGWAKLLHPDDLPKAERDVQRAMETGEYFSEFRVIWPDGSIHWLETRAHVFRDNQDKPVRIMGVNMDITERKQQEEALKESEEKLRLLADTIPQLAWMARPDGHIFWYNRRSYEYTGMSQEQLEGWGWQALLDLDSSSKVLKEWKGAIASGKPFEMVFPLKGADGQFRPFLTRVNPLKDEDGRIRYWFGTNTDIADQKRAEESSRFLAEASAALAGVVDYESTLQKVVNLAVPYFADWSAVDVVNEDGTLRRLAVAHQDAEKIGLVYELMKQYPADPQSPTGAFAVLRTGKPEIVGEISDDMLVQGAKDDRHLRLIRALGLRSYMCVPLVVSGSPFGVLIFATAESGRKYTDADLALANDLANRAGIAIENFQLYQALRDTDQRKDEFLATLAHELRNPLAPIRNSLQILKMPRVDAATIEHSREIMERQVYHLVRLVDDLLDVSRVMRGKIELRKERIELATVVARAVETVQPLVDGQGHDLSVRLPNESLLLDADPVRLAQVIDNLLTNAAKYTESDGRIWLTAEREGDEAVLRVRDNGIGISANMLPRIFELFVQVDHASTKAQGGLGIGLTLVKNLVQMHNGSVEARSAGLGQGSEFVIRLPIMMQAIEQADDRATGQQPQQPPTPSGHRLLIVDDNQDAANSLAMLLRFQGHEVQVAHSGPAALEITKGYVPDVVFLDIGMPGMDGYEVARRLRQQPGLENVVLAALTGWGQKEDRRRTAEAGFNHHLVKPPEPKAVEGLLADLKRTEAR